MKFTFSFLLIYLTSTSMVRAIDLNKSQILAVGQRPNKIIVSDINKNGLNDILVSNQMDGTVSIFYNDTNKGITKAQLLTVGKNPGEMAVADVNNDGFVDLVVANHESSYFHILYNDSLGKFNSKKTKKHMIESDPHIHTLGVADFNQDNIMDVVVDSWKNSKLSIYLGTSDYKYQAVIPSISVEEQPRTNLVVADINHDQWPDIVTPATRKGGVSIVLGNNSKKPIFIATGATPFFTAVADTNLDGNLDILLVHRNGNFNNPLNEAISLLIGDGAGQFKIAKGFPMPIDGAPSAVAAGDIDGNKMPEIVTTNYRDNSITVLSYNQKNDSYTQKSFAVGNRPEGIAIADVIGDQTNEVLVTNREDNNIVIMHFSQSSINKGLK